MLDRGAAAAADDRDAVLADEALEPAGQRLGIERIAGLAVDQLRQAGVRQHRDGPAPVRGEMRQVLGHLLRPGGAVQADDRHVQRLDDDLRRGDVGADQHGAGGLDGDLGHDRQLPAGLAHRDPGAVDRGFQLQRVLAGLAQDHVGAACDQAGRLDLEGLLQALIADVAERGQAGAGADRADHETRATAAGLLDRLVRQHGGDAVDLERLVGEVELAERDRRAAEAVGLDRIGAGREIAAMDRAHQVGPAQVQDLGAVLVAPEIVLDREIAALDLGAHGAVEQQHLVLEGGEEIGHRAVPLRPQPRGRARRAGPAAGRRRSSARRG